VGGESGNKKGEIKNCVFVFEKILAGGTQGQRLKRGKGAKKFQDSGKENGRIREGGEEKKGPKKEELVFQAL